MGPTSTPFDNPPIHVVAIETLLQQSLPILQRRFQLPLLFTFPFSVPIFFNTFLLPMSRSQQELFKLQHQHGRLLPLQTLLQRYHLKRFVPIEVPRKSHERFLRLLIFEPLANGLEIQAIEVIHAIWVFDNFRCQAGEVWSIVRGWYSCGDRPGFLGEGELVLFCFLAEALKPRFFCDGFGASGGA